MPVDVFYIAVVVAFFVNSLTPRDTMTYHVELPSLVQVMVVKCVEPSHHLYQCVQCYISPDTYQNSNYFLSRKFIGLVVMYTKRRWVNMWWIWRTAAYNLWNLVGRGSLWGVLHGLSESAPGGFMIAEELVCNRAHVSLVRVHVQTSGLVDR